MPCEGGGGGRRGQGAGYRAVMKRNHYTFVLSIRCVNLLRLLLLFHINESEKFLLSPVLMSKRPNLRVEYILIRPLIKMRLTGSFIPPA